MQMAGSVTGARDLFAVVGVTRLPIGADVRRFWPSVSFPAVAPIGDERLELECCIGGDGPEDRQFFKPSHAGFEKPWRSRRDKDPGSSLLAVDEGPWRPAGADGP